MKVKSIYNAFTLPFILRLRLKDLKQTLFIDCIEYNRIMLSNAELSLLKLFLIPQIFTIFALYYVYFFIGHFHLKHIFAAWDQQQQVSSQRYYAPIMQG